MSDTKLSESEFERFLSIPLSLLNESINTYHIDAFAYPLSGRSKLVEKMVQVINRMTSRDMTRCSFQLVKSIPTNIYFDQDFKDSDLDKIQKLQHGTNILVVDDINTSGSTLYEIIRLINELNSNCNIYVYTLIGR